MTGQALHVGHTNRCKEALAIREVRARGALRRRGNWLLRALLVFLGLGTALIAHAQSAVFMGEQRWVGSSTSSAFGTAVDAQGNLWVTTEFNGLIEFPAVNGVVPLESSGQQVNVPSGTFGLPTGIAVDAVGDVFVADATQNGKVFEIVAVNGTIPASPTINTITISTGADEPWGLAFDSRGNLWVTEGNNDGVIELEAVGGSIPANPTAVAWYDFSNPRGVWVDASGDVFVADTNNSEIEEMIAVGGSIPASNPTIKVLGSGFSKPYGVAVDSQGDVFVADNGNSELKEMLASGGSVPSNPQIITFESSDNVGNTQNVGSIAIDAHNNVFFTGGDEVNELAQAALFGQLTTGAGSEANQTSAQDPYQFLLFGFPTQGTIAAPAVYTQGATSQDFKDNLTGTCTTNGTSYVYGNGTNADTCIVIVKLTPLYPGARMGAVQLYSTSGGAPIATAPLLGVGVGPMVNFAAYYSANSTYYGSVSSIGTSGLTLGAGLTKPEGVAVDRNHDIFIADQAGDAIIELVAPSYQTQKTVAPANLPSSIAIDGAGDLIWNDAGSSRILEAEAIGGVIPASPTIVALGSGWVTPSATAIDGLGDVFVGDSGGLHEIVAVGGSIPSSPTIRSIETSTNPGALAVDQNGDIFFTPRNSTDTCLYEIPAFSGQVPASPTINRVYCGLASPEELAVDAAGNVWESDGTEGLVEIQAVNGVIPSSPTIISNWGGFSSSFGLGLDGNGNVFASDGTVVYRFDFNTPSSWSWLGTTNVGQSAPDPYTYFVENKGNAPLTLEIPSPSGINPAISANWTWATGATNACPNIPQTASNPGVIPVSGVCSVLISFAPQTSGALSGQLTFTDDNLYVVEDIPYENSNDATQSFLLTGTGIASLTPQTISFTQPTTPVTYSSGLTIPLVATGGASGNPVVFTIDGTSTGTGSITGSTLTVTSAGTFVIDANQAGNSSYSAAPQVQRTVVVTQSSQVAQLQFTPSQLNVIAGTGSGTVNGTGDGGSALLATFDSPAAVAQDSLGNIYVVDSGANYVRKFDVNGNITAFAGVPGYGPGSFSGDNGQATLAHLSNPIGIAIDSSNNVYIADNGNFRIRKVVPSTGVITTYAGTGNGFFTGANAPNTVIPGPEGIAFDSSNNLYIACTNSSLVLKVAASSGATTIVAGVLGTSGSGTPGYNGDNIAANTAEVNFPSAVATDTAGNVYIADTNNNRIRKITVSTGMITTVAGNGTAGDMGDGAAATNAEIYATAVAVDLAGDIFIASDSNGNPPGFDAVRKVAVNGNITTVAGSGSGSTGGEATAAQIGGIGIPAMDSNGDLIIPDYGYNLSTDAVMSSGPAGYLQFGSVNVGNTSSPQTVTFENTGNATLTLSQTTYTATGAFAVTGGTCVGLTSLASGATCTLTVTFTPTSAIAYTGAIAVNSNGTLAAQTIKLAGTGVSIPAPVVSLTPSPVAFGNQTINTTSASSMIAVLMNTGNATLSSISISVTGTNANAFGLNSSACGTTLAAGASCNISLNFTPTATGANTASLTVSDNAGNSPQSITLTGTGLAANVVAPSPLVFNPAPVGIPLASAQTLTATFQMNGYGAGFTPTATLHYGLSYSIGAVSCTGAVGSETCSVPVTFQPQYPGGRRDAIFLMSGTTRLATLLIYGIGQGPFSMVQPGVITNPILNNANYLYTSIVDENGTVYILGDNSNTIYTVTRAGVVGTLPVTGLNSPRGIGIDGAGVLYIADQTYNGPTKTYDTVQAIQGSVPFPVPNTYIQSLGVGNTGNIYETDYVHVYTVPIVGTGTAATTLITPANTQASNLIVDSNENLFVGGYEINEITSGGVQSQINTVGAGEGIGVDPADTVYATRYTLGGVAELAASSYSTALAYLDSTASPLGMSIAPDGTVYVGNYTNLDKVDRTQGLIAFGEQSQALGTASPQQIATIYNGGNQTLTISNIAITGNPFSIQTAPTGTNCSNGGTVAPGALCQIAVVVTPAHAGVFSGSITVTSNSLNTTSTTQTIALTAFAYGVYVTPPSPSLTFPNQIVNTTSAAQTITLTNNGDLYTATFGTPVSGNSVYSVGLGTCTTGIAVGASCNLSVTFTPTLAQSYNNVTATVPYSSSGGGAAPAPVTITLSGTGIPAAAPQAVLSPNPLAFPGTLVGTPASTMPMTLSNPGNAALTITSISVTGTNASSFGQSNNCGGSLAAGATCTITVAFTPGSTGSLTAAISVADNATGSPQSAVITGTGTAPQAVLSPNPLPFPSTLVGTAATALPMTLSNPGTAALTITGISVTGTNASSFGQANNCGSSLAAGANCTITVTFTPGSTGGLTAAISVADNATGSPQSATVTGTGTQPQAMLAPNPLAFPSTRVGTAATALPITLSNPGTAALTITSIAVTGTNASSFGETNNCGSSLAASATCTITVTFTPASAGSLSAAISVADNATGSPQSATLTGTGTAPQAVLSPNPLAFPNTLVGTPATALPMTLSNPGTAALTITSISVTGTNASSFGETNNCGSSLAAGATCTITVTFTPASAASLTAAISVADNATGSPQSATLTGTGTAPLVPQAVLTPNPLAFPSTTINTSSTLPLTLSNPGNTALTITSISVTGANASSFGETNNCGSSLAVGATCTITVTFTPASAASLTAAISVADNAAGSPQSATLTGTGSAGIYAVNSSTPAASIQPGAVAQYNLNIVPLGGSFNNLVTLSATGLPAGAQVSFQPPAVTPGSAGAPSVMSIQTSTGLARLATPEPHRQNPVPLLAVLAGLPLLGLAAGRRLRRSTQRWMLLGLAVLAILPALAISGCGGGYFGPAPQTYTVTVVGTSGSLQETTTVSLTVQ
jgi:sugar lactone lactonase YvrE